MDIAIVGENLLIETGKKVEIVCKLGFSKCRVSLAVRKEIEEAPLSYFNEKKMRPPIQIRFENSPPNKQGQIEPVILYTASLIRYNTNI